jgi:hypothetical protein
VKILGVGRIFLPMAPLKTYVVSHGALIFILRVFALRAVIEERIKPVNRGITVSSRKRLSDWSCFLCGLNEELYGTLFDWTTSITRRVDCLA